VKLANNTPAGELLGKTAEAPRGLDQETPTFAAESAESPQSTLQPPPPAVIVQPHPLVTLEDLASSATLSSISRAMLWSIRMLLPLLAVILL
jgi:hypothetical protein